MDLPQFNQLAKTGYITLSNAPQSLLHVFRTDMITDALNAKIQRLFSNGSKASKMLSLNLASMKIRILEQYNLAQQYFSTSTNLSLTEWFLSETKKIDELLVNPGRLSYGGFSTWLGEAGCVSRRL